MQNKTPHGNVSLRSMWGNTVEDFISNIWMRVLVLRFAASWILFDGNNICLSDFPDFRLRLGFVKSDIRGDGRGVIAFLSVKTLTKTFTKKVGNLIWPHQIHKIGFCIAQFTKHGADTSQAVLLKQFRSQCAFLPSSPSNCTHVCIE